MLVFFANKRNMINILRQLEKPEIIVYTKTIQRLCQKSKSSRKYTSLFLLLFLGDLNGTFFNEEISRVGNEIYWVNKSYRKRSNKKQHNINVYLRKYLYKK